MRINYLIILFFVISYSFSIGAEIEIILSEDLLTNQETLKDFQLTLLHINSNENKFLQTVFKDTQKILNVEGKKTFQEILSRKNIVTLNKELDCFKKFSLRSLDKEKIIKEDTFTFITFIEISNAKIVMEVRIFDKNSTQEKPLLGVYMDLNESSFKKKFYS